MSSQTVLVTGSTSGIGMGIAQAYAQKGYNVVFNGLEKDGAAIAREIADKHGINYLFSPANMLQPAALRAMVQAATEKFGAVDILVNNAGIQYVAAIENFPEEKWDAILNINLTAAFHLTKAVWPGMKQRGFGRIINIASAHGLVASEYKSAYVAAKHGLVGLTKTAALEGAPFGITCNAICPGYVRTALVDQQIAEQAKAHQIPENEVIQKVFLSKQAIKEFVPVEAIAEMCLLLSSKNASGITGTAMPVDGGWIAQ